MEQLEELTLFDIYAYNPENFGNLVIRFAFNSIVTGIIMYFFYYRNSPRKDYLMTFSLISITVFFLVILLDSVKLQMGFALGLFAIFGIIRYRTISIPIKEMTYLFVIIGISVINALASKKISYVEILFTNAVFLGFCWLYESNRIKKHISVKLVMYDNVKLIAPNQSEALKADLEKRLGLSIVKVEIGKVDFIRDSALLHVSYRMDSKEVNTADSTDNFTLTPDL